MFLDVKELAVRKLRIRKTYAPGSIDFHSAEIKQVEPLEVTATAELLESQIRIEGNLETKIELVCARCLEPVVEDVSRTFDLFYAPLPKDAKPKEDQLKYPGAPAGGIYVAYIGGPQATGSMTQMLGATVQANTTYTLTIKIGARNDEVFTGYVASLVAGNVTLASGNSSIPLGGKFVNEVIVYNSGPTPAQLGQPLQIFVGSMGTGQTNVSDVTLTYKPE